MKYLRLIPVLALVALAACVPSVPQRGAISISFGDTSYAKSIVPGGSMDVVEYALSGTGPGSEAIPETVVTGSTTLTDLVPGSWTLTAVGRNAAHVAIGEGSATVSVVIGQTSTANITVVEYSSPNGSYRLDLSWTPDIVDNPVFVGTLKDSANAVTAQTFTLDTVACTAESVTAALHPGWYANVVALYDQPGDESTRVLSTGFAEAVRIAAGQETAGTVALHAVQGFGVIDVNFNLDFSDPLVLSPSPAFGNMTVYSIPAHFSITADKAATYVWYLRGQQIGVGDTLDLDTSGMYFGETYRLDVIGFSVDGKHAASGTWTLLKQDWPAESYTVTLSGQRTQDGNLHLVVADVAGNVVDDFRGSYESAPAVTSHAFTVPSGSYKLGYKATDASSVVYLGGDGTLSGATVYVVPSLPPIAVNFYAY